MTIVHTYLLSLGNPSELGDLDVDDIRGPVAPDFHEAVHIRHVLIQDEWKVGVAADREALLEGDAGLLQVHVQPGHRLGHAQSLVGFPA